MPLVRDALEEYGASFEPLSKGKLGYRSAQAIELDGSIHGLICSGGNGGRYFLEIKGEHAHNWQDWVSWNQAIDQSPEPFALLSRADSCYDFLDPDQRDVHDLYPSAREAVDLAVTSATGKTMQWDQRGDWLSYEGRSRGLTAYCGSPKSPIRVRLYDKGRELKGRGIEARDNLIRLEVQFRPRTPKERFEWVRHSASLYWGVSHATRAFSDFFKITDASPIASDHRIPSDVDRLIMLMCVQYGRKALIPFIGDLFGDDAAVLVAQKVEEYQEAHKAFKRRVA